MLAESFKVSIKNDVFHKAPITELYPVERGMMIQANERETWLLNFIADKYKVTNTCEKAIDEDWWILQYVPDQCKTQRISERIV